MKNPERETVCTERNPFVERQLLDRWTDKLEQIQLAETGRVITQKHRFLSMLLEAQSTQQPLVFIALGCQDWIKPEWGNPAVDRILGKIRPDDKRAKRFISEMVSFSRALKSFSILHEIHFSLSDIEPLLHIHLKNMGLVIHNENAEEVMSTNVGKMAEVMSELDVPIKTFSHNQLISQLLDLQDFSAIQNALSKKENATYREFLDELYAFDLQRTQQHFARENTVGPVWLDIQSSSFIDDVLSFGERAKQVAPELPILSVFPNAGNWHASHQATATFSSRTEIIAQMIGLQNIPGSTDEWLKKIHKTRDEVLVAALESLVNEKPVISSAQEKMTAVRMFFQLAFHFDPMSDQKNC